MSNEASKSLNDVYHIVLAFVYAGAYLGVPRVLNILLSSGRVPKN